MVVERLGGLLHRLWVDAEAGFLEVSDQALGEGCLFQAASGLVPTKACGHGRMGQWRQKIKVFCFFSPEKKNFLKPLSFQRMCA